MRGGTARRPLILVVAAAAACARGEPPPSPRASTTLPPREPTVSIGIAVAVDSALVTAGGDATVRVAGGATLARSGAGETWVFAVDSAGRIVARSASGTTLEPVDGLIRLVPDGDEPVRIGGAPFRGEALIRVSPDRRITVVNVLDLERYLLGVVPFEMGHRPVGEIEALKAQAVAARTYAIGNMGSRQTLGFDFFATDMDQVYGGLAGEDSIVSRAVRETAGEIVTYDGQPILAYYSSTCGGKTAAIEDSWPWQPPQPYLKSVSDRIPGTDTYYCDTSSRFRWTTHWTRAQLLRVLGESLRNYTGGALAPVRRVDDLEVVGRNGSGRATLRLTADGRSYVLRDDSLRWVLHPPDGRILNSSMITDLHADHDGEGIAALELTGGGWGHAVGMCQVGAMGRARAGQKYDEILKAYYTGTRIQKLY